MNNQVYFDEIIHVFRSKDALHFVVGASSGSLNADGSELKQPVATLIVPVEVATFVLQQINTGITALIGSQSGEKSSDKTPVKIENEVLGVGITVLTRQLS